MIRVCGSSARRLRRPPVDQPAGMPLESAFHNAGSYDPPVGKFRMWDSGRCDAHGQSFHIRDRPAAGKSADSRSRSTPYPDECGELWPSLDHSCRNLGRVHAPSKSLPIPILQCSCRFADLGFRSPRELNPLRHFKQRLGTRLRLCRQATTTPTSWFSITSCCSVGWCGFMHSVSH